MTSPAFRFYASDFLASTSEMTAEEVGVHIRLLCHQWMRGGLPNDDERLLAMAGQCQASSLAYAKKRFGLCEDGQLRHQRLEEERAKQDGYRQKQAANGAKRWAGNAKPQALAKPSQMPDACLPYPYPSPTPEIQKTSPPPYPPPPAADVHNCGHGEKTGTAMANAVRRKPSSLAECLAMADRVGMSESAARDWYRDMEASGWAKTDGTPFGNWVRELTMHRDRLKSSGNGPPSRRNGAGGVTTAGRGVQAQGGADREAENLLREIDRMSKATERGTR